VLNYPIFHQDAVKKLFQRALQYCDPKKLHLALLGLYERADQLKLADELLEKMVKKFKTSCKVLIMIVVVIVMIIVIIILAAIASSAFF